MMSGFMGGMMPGMGGGAPPTGGGFPFPGMGGGQPPANPFGGGGFPNFPGMPPGGGTAPPGGNPFQMPGMPSGGFPGGGKLQAARAIQEQAPSRDAKRSIAKGRLTDRSQKRFSTILMLAHRESATGKCVTTYRRGNACKMVGLRNHFY